MCDVHSVSCYLMCTAFLVHLICAVLCNWCVQYILFDVQCSVSDVRSISWVSDLQFLMYLMCAVFLLYLMCTVFLVYLMSPLFII